jgi:hypothetical protein
MVARVRKVVRVAPGVVQAAASAGEEPQAESVASVEARVPAGQGAAEQVAALVVSAARAVLPGEAAPAAVRLRFAVTGSASRARQFSIVQSTAACVVTACARLARTAIPAQPIV